jgi:hypothetical protein
MSLFSARKIGNVEVITPVTITEDPDLWDQASERDDDYEGADDWIEITIEELDLDNLKSAN